MLKATNIHKSYGALEVLKGVDLEIKKGEVISITGASGAGKSTLLHILGTLDTPDNGVVLLNDVDVVKLSNKKRGAFRNNEIGFVFQFHNLLPEFSAIENICLPALIKGVDFKTAKKNAQALLSKLSVEKRADHKPSQLSGGEQQRVAVARSLINNPSIVFADEPSGNLDSKNADDLHQMFFKLRDEFNQTFVIVTHSEKLANMADRKLKMKDGLFV